MPNVVFTCGAVPEGDRTLRANPNNVPLSPVMLNGVKHLGRDGDTQPGFFASLHFAQNDNFSRVPVQQELANTLSFESVSLSIVGQLSMNPLIPFVHEENDIFVFQFLFLCGFSDEPSHEFSSQLCIFFCIFDAHRLTIHNRQRMA